VKRSIAVAASAVLVVLLGFSVLLVTRQPLAATPTSSPLLGKPAPAVSATELSGGRFSLHQDLGDVVVLTFWASWCDPCKAEVPNLITFAWQHRHDKVRLVGVVFNDTLASATSFDRFYGARFPSVVDPQGRIAFSYGVTAPPSTFVIDARGRVAATLIGPVSTAQLNAVVARVAR